MLKSKVTGLCLIMMLMTGCSRQSSHHAQGYIEGNYTYVATSVSGDIHDLLVQRGTWVKKGQTLFVLEPQPESDLYAAAVENLKQAVYARDAVAADLVYAKLTLERDETLVPKKAIQQSVLDNARSVYQSTLANLAKANANIASSNAAMAQAKWTRDQKIVKAPVDALVFDTYYRLGEYTTANQPVLSLLAPSDVKAIFYISEADLGGVKLNDHVSVQCDSCATPRTGYVSFISPTAEYTPPVIYSEQTREKLVYRIEARFEIEEAKQLHPGQPVTVTYLN